MGFDKLARDTFIEASIDHAHGNPIHGNHAEDFFYKSQDMRNHGVFCIDDIIDKYTELHRRGAACTRVCFLILCIAARILCM